MTDYTPTMTTAEAIDAAILYLEVIKSDAAWTYSPEARAITANGEWVASRVAPPDGARILMLHRTIDAQLAFLRDAQTIYVGDLDDSDPAVVLARAITSGMTRAIDGGDEA